MVMYLNLCIGILVISEINLKGIFNIILVRRGRILIIFLEKIYYKEIDSY